MRREFLAAWVVLVACEPAFGIINANFTPKHLTDQSDVILAGPVQETSKPAEWKLTKTAALKGTAGAEFVLDLAKCNKDQIDDVKKMLAASGKAPVMLFYGTMNEKKSAFLHVRGTWLSLAEGSGKDRWDVLGFDPQMGGTYVGGTEMLTNMVKYLLADVDADVPVGAGIRWAGNCKVGQLKGEVAGATAVELGEPAKLHLHVAYSEGDKLYRPKKDKDEDGFEDVTAAAKLDAKSRQFAWIDVNRDGLADLVSHDGKAIGVFLAAKDGTFKPGDASWKFSVEGECIGLAGCSTDGAPAVLVSTDGAPVLLLAGDAGWKKAALPTSDAAKEEMGRPSACVVADLDNDGFADILQPKEKGGVLWRGKADGFEKPVASPVCTGRGAGVAALGDFDGNGFLDIFLSGGDRNSIWENDGKAGFQEVFGQAGSVSYKCPARPNDVKVVDLNHDGRPDLCLVYPEADLLYHWNRGFRSFGEEGEVRLSAQAPEPGRAPVGQKTFCVADFNGDFSQDLVVVTTTGDIWCYFNERCDRPGVNFRLKKGTTGPVTASCWMGDQKTLVCLGSVPVTGHSTPAYLAARFSGTLAIKYRLPGQAEQTQKVNVEDKTVDVILGEKPATTGKSK